MYPQRVEEVASNFNSPKEQLRVVLRHHYPGSDWKFLRARGVNTISLSKRDSAYSELEIVKEGGVHEEELPPNGNPTSESQGQSVFPIKTLDGGDVGEDVSKITQNEEAKKKEDDRDALLRDYMITSASAALPHQVDSFTDKLFLPY